MSTSYSANEIREMIESLRADDTNSRLNAVGKIKTIARALGPSRTKNELIPYIAETVDNTEEVWLKVAEQMPQIIDEIGGIKEATVILQLLKQICEIEDPNVQTTASIMFFAISRKATQEELVNQFYPIIQSMCVDNWHPLRCAAAMIMCHTYALYPESHRKKLAIDFPSLAVDQMTIVRKSLASALPALIQTAKTKDQTDLVEKVLTTLAGDLSHSVLIEIPRAIADLPPEQKDLRVSAIKRVFSSPRWQARAVLADNLDKVFKGVDNCGDIVKNIAQPASIDAAIEVRTSIARHLPFIFASKAFGEPEFTKFVQCLSSDKDPSVRAAIAASIGSVDGAPKDLVEETLTLLLDDSENSVKVAALQSVAKTGLAVVPAAKHIQKIIKYANWRMKITIPQLLPQIAHTTTKEFFDENYMSLVESLLTNESADVRKNMVQYLPNIVKVYGDDWKKGSLVPVLTRIFDTIDYQIRQTVIESIFSVNLMAECSQILDKAVTDPVPNVRIVLAKYAADYKFVSITDKLAKDEDKDVAYFSKKHE